MHSKIRKGIKGVDKHKPYLLAEVLETVELFTELYAVTCFGTRATTALSDTCRHRNKDYHRQLTKKHTIQTSLKIVVNK